MHFTRSTLIRNLQSVRGFTLLELAIVISIIGLLAGLGFPLLSSLILRDKISKTQDHQQQVLYALASYVLMNNRLPCPADPAATGAEVGLMRIRCDQKAGDAEGIIPFRSLGINESVAKDGFNHWMTYAVAPGLTDLGIKIIVDEKMAYHKAQVFCQVDASDAVIKLLTDDNQSVIDAKTEVNPIAVIVISHGPKGYGSYIGQGTKNRYLGPSSLGTDKEENCNGDLTFRLKPQQPAEDATFDDRVIWASRAHLLGYYGKMPCRRS